MIHVNSRNFSKDTGGQTSYNGLFTLDRNVATSQKLVHTFVDEQAMPWVYNGNNTLRLFDIFNLAAVGNVDVVVTPDPADFITDPPNDPAVIAKWELAFNTAMSAGNNTMSIAFINATGNELYDKWVLTFDTEVDLIFSDVPEGETTNCDGIFGYPPTVVNDKVYTLPLVATGRPMLLALHLTEAETGVNTSNPPGATLMVPTDGTLIPDQTLSIRGYVNELNIDWRRHTAPDAVLPMPNDWDIVFVPG